MDKLDIVVRAAGRSDVPEIARMLARAFEDDPGFAYHLPHGPSRLRRSYRYFATLLKREALQLRGTEIALVDGKVVGAAIWKPPNEWRPPAGVQLATLAGYASCFQLGSLRAMKTEAVMFAEHPSDPHWYLYVLGTEPALQGHGVGAALLRSRLERCDLDGLPAYLESSKAANVPIYRHFGFEPTGLLALPEGAPPFTKMWRPGTAAVQAAIEAGAEPAVIES